MRTFILAFSLVFSQTLFATPIADYLREAIEVGRSSGVVTGPVLAESRSKLRATGPLSVTVTRLHKFQQEGCARLSMSFNQADAMPPGTHKPAAYKWDTQLSICSDGQAPVNTQRLDTK